MSENWIEEDTKKINIYNISNQDYIRFISEFWRLDYIDFNINELPLSYIILRQLDFKDGIFDYSGGCIHYSDEILLLKLAKLGLIQFDLIGFKHDITSKFGKEFYAFMDKYTQLTENYRTSCAGTVTYNLDKIFEDDYEKFIYYIFETLKQEVEENLDDEWYDWDEVECNRLDSVVKLKKPKAFFEKLNKLFLIPSNNENIEKDIIKQLNSTDGSQFKIEYDELINNKLGLSYFYIKYLEEKGKLKIKSIELEGGSFVYKIESFIPHFNEVTFANFEYVPEGDNISYKNQKFFNNGELIHTFKDEYNNINLFFKALFSKKEGENITFREIQTYLDKAYDGISTLTQKQDKDIRNLMTRGNKIREKTFLMGKGGAESQIHWKN